ncbi:hypothetical protein [Frisingicoccus sp.]|uniref:hypothetical protein n=1 Tax=Frisingicoccus sp. TaxID=1918627 RepID=UPI003AB14940
MSNELMNQEIREAIDAGERALISLRAAQDKLNSARNWGIFDMIGGSFFSSLMKRSQIDGASEYMAQAQLDLRRLQKELRDIQVPMDLKIEVSDFLSFADVFFDNLLVDWMVQNKIAEARGQVEDAIFRVESILMDLRNLENRPW